MSIPHASDTPPADLPPCTVRRPARSSFLTVRGLRLHLLRWGDDQPLQPERPALVLLHGWMDVAASFQFMVDAFAGERRIVALDWRGFGLSERPAADSYWFPDYLGDLDGVLDALVTSGDLAEPVDLLGHSMGANVAMLYAGARPGRIRRLVNLEGFGLPPTTPEMAPGRYARWMDELRRPERMRRYERLDEVVARLCQGNPRLAPQRARWLAPHWARQAEDGLWDILGDPAHKRVNPVLYQRAEAVACWQAITAPVLWVEGALTDLARLWGPSFSREDFDRGLAAVPQLRRAVIEGAGHMLHHDQPEALAAAVEDFLDRP